MSNRKLDALFAERVLGCRVHYGPDPCPVCKGTKIEPTSTAYAWRVPIDGPSPGYYHAKAGDPCFQCKGKGEVNWNGDGPVCRCKGANHDDDRGDLNYYTTSLDAAWEGVEKTGWGEVTGPFAGRAPDRRYQADIQRSDSPHPESWITTTAPHPALAIVLACLRAVGTSEEEIEEAQR